LPKDGLERGKRSVVRVEARRNGVGGGTTMRVPGCKPCVTPNLGRRRRRRRRSGGRITGTASLGGILFGRHN